MYRLDIGNYRSKRIGGSLQVPDNSLPDSFRSGLVKPGDPLE
jgi:hypothetical protein